MFLRAHGNVAGRPSFLLEVLNASPGSLGEVFFPISPIFLRCESLMPTIETATATSRMMRNINRSAILDVIREHSPISRSQIAERLGLSLPTVMRIVDDLIKADLVRPFGKPESSGGRPRPLLAFNAQGYAVIGVDLGGTKLFGTVADLAGHIQNEVYVPWGADGTAESVERLCGLIVKLLHAPRPAGQKIRGIGVGAPGVTLGDEGIVTYAPSLGWRDLPLKEILCKRFRHPTFVENDVNLAALGEWGFGAGKGSRDVVCIAIGTGIGAGIILDGTLFRGHNLAAGEIGYLLPGTEFLGRRYDEFGALESLASGTGIAARANDILRAAAASRPCPVTAEEVFAAARQGTAWAMQVVNETVDYLALAIGSIAAILNPEVIVIGGGVSQSADLLVEPIKRRLDGVLPNIPRIVTSTLGPRAAVMGAIVLVLNETTEHVMVHRYSRKR
jgi:glucokinase-like ROK family protein